MTKSNTKHDENCTALKTNFGADCDSVANIPQGKLVLPCNAHDQLVADNARLREALQICVRLLDRCPSFDPNGESVGRMTPESARAALAATEKR